MAIEIEINVVMCRSRPALPLVPEPLEGSGGDRVGRQEEEEVCIFYPGQLIHILNR